MKSRATAGYTILEVMIVLAVTGALFLAAVLMLSGKQAQAETTQAARNFESQMQTTANDVANGFYPSGFLCQPSGTTVLITAGAVPAGSNQGCIFLGKIINLRKSDADIITVVGRQYFGPGTTDVKSLAEAGPVVVANGAVTTVTQNYAYSYSLELQKAVSIDGGTGYQAIAFMNELGGGIGATSTGSGSRGVQLWGIAGSVAANSTPDTLVAPSALVQIPKGVRLCFISGTGKKVEITIGAAGDQTNTNVLIDGGVGSEC